MARQVKTSKRKYVEDRTEVKCASCGNYSKDTTIIYINGIARWICSICANRTKSRNRK